MMGTSLPFPRSQTEIMAGLSSSAPECGPSAEEKEENEEQQRLELEALLSIYPEEIATVKEATEYLVTISPRIDSSIQLLLPVTPGASGSPTPRPPLPPSLPQRCTDVTHLPPLTLYIRYHAHYPSSRPPDFHLSARWLDPNLSTFVSEKLGELFTPEYPVVFDWINYLQDEFIPDYTAHQKHTLPPMPPPAHREGSPDVATSSVAESSASDPGVGELLSETLECHNEHPRQLFLRSTSQMDDMEQFDQFEVHKEFLGKMHVCEVCLLEVAGRGFCEPCPGCGKLYCKDCIREYCQVSIQEGTVSNLSCPNPTCDSSLSDPQLLQVLPDELFQRFDRLRDELHLDSIPGMIFCPRSWCGSRVVSEPESDLAVCPECGFPFCKVCRQTWHGPGSCPALEKVDCLKPIGIHHSAV